MFDVLSKLLIFATVLTVMLLVIYYGVKGSEEKRKKEKDKQDILDDLNKIKTASKHWDRERKLAYMNYLAERYNWLKKESNKPLGPTKAAIMANVNDDLGFFALDLDALHDLYHYIDVTLDD